MQIEQACQKGKEIYQASLSPDASRQDWHLAVDRSLEELRSLLVASHDLTQIRKALVESGAHMRALRHLLTPPLSQDQFKLACPNWPKTSEKRSAPLRLEVAAAISDCIERWLDPRLLEELEESGEVALLGAAYLMARQDHETVRRNRLAREQEADVCAILGKLGFIKKEMSMVNQPGALEFKQYLLTTKFATADNSAHEVDVAVGLPNRNILAIECKVSNDATNSIKRTNDVMKKSEAWKRQWGQFVTTGAVIQGVFRPTEVIRMQDSGILVFWSHDLTKLEDWISNWPSKAT